MRALLRWALTVVAAAPATAEQPPPRMPQFGRTGITTGVVVYGADGNVVSFPARPMQTPFLRKGAAFALPVFS